MNRRPMFWLTLGVLVFSAASASAQSSIQDSGKYTVDPDGNLIRRTRLELACGPALERFCPDAIPGQTRNQVICLKPYRTSLTSYCRAAVNTAMK